LRILFFGDIVGRPGRRGISAILPNWAAQYRPDVVIANGENAAGGIGISPAVAEELLDLGIDLLTLGNHAWQKRDVYGFLDANTKIIRPLNMPPGVPGRGYAILDVGGQPLAVVNLCGRIFLGEYDDPFRAIDGLLAEIDSPNVLVDFHAETSSEKQAFGWFVDGRVSAVIGTHTHVQTADDRILPGGTAYITDVGMCGPQDSVIGMDRDIILHRFLTQLPTRFEVAKGDPLVCAAVVEISEEDGKATRFGRLQWRKIDEGGPILESTWEE
jgi:metallophosphoesterase (TIGR00282 family)